MNVRRDLDLRFEDDNEPPGGGKGGKGWIFLESARCGGGAVSTFEVSVFSTIASPSVFSLLTFLLSATFGRRNPDGYSFGSVWILSPDRQYILMTHYKNLLI